MDPKATSSAPTRAPRSPTTSAPSKLQPDTIPALRELVEDVNREVALYKEFKSVPAQDQTNVRNDMYVASEALRLMEKTHNPAFTAEESAALDELQEQGGQGHQVHSRLGEGGRGAGAGPGHHGGLEAHRGHRGEKIGKEHLTYAQGASAGLVAMGTIFAADKFGLPVSTTHILSSGVAGTMAANGSGLRLSTVRNIAAGWVFTLPAAALLSGCSTGSSVSSPEAHRI